MHFVFGGVGEAFTPPTPYVPGAVLVAARVVYVMGSALPLSGAAALIYGARARRQPSRVR
jgi:hypothetical protein